MEFFLRSMSLRGMPNNQPTKQPPKLMEDIGTVKKLASTGWVWKISRFWTTNPNSVFQSDLFKIEDKSVCLKLSVYDGFMFVRLVSYFDIGNIERKFSVDLTTRGGVVIYLNPNSESLPALGEISFHVSVDKVTRILPYFPLILTLRVEPLISGTVSAEQGTSQVTDECVAGESKKESSDESGESEELILPKPKSLTNLMISLKELLQSENNTDVILKVKGKDFKAHRCILTSRSPVLMSTFEHDMEEKRTGVVKIDDCDPESFYDFLLFLYTGRTAQLPNSDHAIELYKTAHKYDVPDLREDCVVYLKSNLKVENVCDAMHLALQYDEDQLNEVAKEFFFNNCSAVAETPQFDEFFLANTKVAQKLIEYIRR